MSRLKRVEAHRRNDGHKIVKDKKKGFQNREKCLGKRWKRFNRTSVHKKGNVKTIAERNVVTENGTQGEVVSRNFFSNSDSNSALKKIDTDTIQYFMEISSLLSSGSSITDTEERANLIANALEETHGKELELSCDKTCSGILEMLIHACDASQIASFLHRASPKFSSMAIDAAGSHVAETLLKSSALLLNNYDKEAAWFKTMNEGLNLICQFVGDKAVDLMCNCYGSHVIRSLLYLLSGMKFEDSNKMPKGRLRCISNRFMHHKKSEDVQKQGSIVFPRLLQFLINQLMEATKRKALQLSKDPFASPVLQVLLRILADDSNETMKAIRLFLDCDSEGNKKDLRGIASENLKELIFDYSGSHLVEVMLDVAPDPLYMELFQEISTHHILEYALHQSANYVVQTLILSLRNHDQLEYLLAELQPNFQTLIKEMRSGIIMSLLNVCKKFRLHEKEVCKSLGKAVNVDGSSPSSLVPRLLFLESFAKSNSSKDWQLPFGHKMSVLGCLMLQLIFGFPEECCEPFWKSLLRMEPIDLVTTSKDPGGCHVIESFLSSGVSWKQKKRLISKLKGHFEDLAKHTSSAFVVEKCFSVGKIEVKEIIVSELALTLMDLEKIKHGPHLIKKFDIHGYRKAPEQWKKRISAKEVALKAFADVFNEGNYEKDDQLDLNESHNSGKRKFKDSKKPKASSVLKKMKIQD